MRKILLVDDEREEREGIAFLIRKYEYPLLVSQASNGVKALEYLEQNRVDILFTDVKMPMMDGLELAKEVNQRYPGIKIIIFSAYGEFDYAKKALEANAVNYLLKPIEVDEFKTVMERLLELLDREQQEKEEQQQESWQNRQNVFYKLLTGAPVKEGERLRAQGDLFVRNTGCRVLYIEFLDCFFEKYEELFLKFVRMYLGEQTEYINLLSNEACLILRDRKYMDRDFLEGQLEKFLRDIRTFGTEGMLVTVSRIVDDMEAFARQVEAIQEVRREFFGVGDMVVWMEEERNTTYYANDVEIIRKQLLMAVKAERTELIPKLADQLVQVITAGHMVSKLYVQNLFFAVIQAIYDKYPDVLQEEILKSSDILFYAKNSREMVSLFQKRIHEMLAVIEKKPDDDSAVIHKIKNLVEKEYMHDLSLNDIAEMVNLAPAYVSYIFKKETGNTLIKYMTEIRMEKARMLLEEGKLKVVQIARVCGYENQSYFNRTFKNYFGVTPKQFREGQSL